MSHFAVNWLAILLATVASMGLGIVWYMVLARQWLAATGRMREEIDAADRSPFVWSLIVQLVTAYFLALTTPLLFGAATVQNGLLCAAHMWLGFVITTMIQGHRYGGRPWRLTIIDGGYMLGMLLLQGAIIGVFGGPVPAVA